ncbi:hypothetical protein PoB_000248300 [Plakobranchus ocellatus]|uniref:Uncharacterized protein n=1 Tax=Plakobranchus ocellatus TaxID=259542 RepID=A0AAV3Y011_9GAST|nr:hypothetical protein PoB_000248300 [Plakobranchus ocellatus]
MDVLVTVGANKYRINGNGKEKTFHGNLLKNNITRGTVSDEAPMGNGPVSAASQAVGEDDDKGSGCDDFWCEVLPGLDGWVSNEAVKGIKLVISCLRNRKINWKSWQSVSPQFSNSLTYSEGAIAFQDENVEKDRAAPRPRPKRRFVRFFI